MKQVILCLTCTFMLVAVAICTGSFTCGTGSCPSGTGCCVWSPPGSSAINQCYDTNTFSCVNDQSISNEKCLCIQGQSCCNKACYNPSTFQCTQNFGNNGPTCLCTPGQSCCNGQCFDPNIFFCVLADNKPGKRCLCQVGAHTNCYFNYETGHQTCYNDNTQTVCPNGNIVYTNQIATVTITQSGGSNTCGGGPVTLTCSATGNQGPYSYSWTTSNGGTIGGATNVAQITALTSGDYKCTAVGVDNCPVSKTKTVTISTSTISATITANPSPSTCGQPVTLTCNPQGATNPVQYTWTTIGGNIPAGTQNSQSITVPISGQYTCSIQDANGCTATASQQVTITNLQAQVSPTSASSCNAPIQFTCTPIGVTPVPPTFTWVASEGGVITGPSNTPQITASLPGKYTCIVNSGPCMATAFGTITQGNCVCTNFRVFIDPQYGSTENTGSKAILDFAFAQSGANTVLTLTIINNSGPVQSTLVGVAFDLPSNLQVSAYNDLGTSFTTLWTNPDLPPYGTFDTGISPPRMSFAGGNPQSGIDTGAQITVQFTFNNLNANTLAQDFFNGFSSGALRSVGRFQRVNGEGSDKVLGGGVVCV